MDGTRKCSTPELHLIIILDTSSIALAVLELTM